MPENGNTDFETIYSTYDCIVAIGQLHEATHIHIADLQDGKTEYDIGSHGWWKLGLLLLQANRESYDLLLQIRVERARYLRNMQILYQEYEAKYCSLYEKYGSHEAAQSRVGDYVIESAYELVDLVEDINEQPLHKDYLTDIFRFWRRYGGKHEHEPYEEVWRWVAGRPLPHLEKTRFA